MLRELITFEVGDQLFGLDITAIREIRAWSPVTRLPEAPGFVAGVVNLRGVILPVIDLSARLGWNETEATSRHAIIVTQIDNQMFGLIVHSVSDIVTVPSDALQSPPANLDDAALACLEGMVPSDGHIIMILNARAISDAGVSIAA